MMRVILDANVWISLLLRRSEDGPIRQAFLASFSENVELIVPQELIGELQTAIIRSSYLASRIPKNRIDTLVEQFYASAIIPPIAKQQGQFTRDPKDDYLIVYSLLYKVDYLITGDRDLLTLQRVGNLRIVTPSQFVEIL